MEHKGMTPSEIMETRKGLRLNRAEFGRFIGVSPRTIENWEQGRRTPRGPALRALENLRREIPR